MKSGKSLRKSSFIKNRSYPVCCIGGINFIPTFKKEIGPCCADPKLTVFIGGSGHSNKDSTFFKNWLTQNLSNSGFLHIKKLAGAK